MKPILVVEDDKFLRSLLVTKLEASNFKTTVAVNGREALEVVKKDLPSLILLDLILPVMNGFEVLEALKKDDQTAKIPVLILSNLGQTKEVEKGIKLGAIDYLVKAHFTPEEIVSKIRKILKTK